MYIHICLYYVISVAPSCTTLCNYLDCNMPGSSVHRIFQARVLGAMSGVPLPSPIYILLYITYITNEDVTFNTVNYTQYFVITNKEKESEKEYIYKHTYTWVQFSSVQFSRSVMSNSLWPHELQHTRPPCPSPTARVYPNPCPLSRCCHPTISSSSSPALNFSQHQGLFQWVSS